MDSRRFDALTRSLASGTSRRTLLKGLFGGAALGGAAITRVDDVVAQACDEGQFLCNGECCPNANNCCGGITCCPSSQCHDATGTCCETFEFACDAGTGDNICCNSGGEKCCDGFCLDAAFCCPSLGDCTGEGLLCCEAGQFCSECCDSDDCPGECSVCNQGFCENDVGLCDPCEFCTDGTCDPQVILCEGGTVACCINNELTCVECCTADQCDPPDDCTAAQCVDNSCLEVSSCVEQETCCPDGECRECCDECCGNDDCDLECDVCLNGTCVPACEEGAVCCVSGPPEDVTITCVEECCDDDGCGECESCVDGVCEPHTILCAEPHACCVDGQLVCAECCDHDDCGSCEVCFNGACYPDDECCPRYGEVCSQISIAGGSPQGDCCEGLVCCDGDPPICAECCSDHDCDKGECCCKDGTCSHKCCDRHHRCKHDKHCPPGKCCCGNGHCSGACCDPPGKTPPEIDTLPNTGSGDAAGDGLGAFGALTVGAAAMYVAGKRLRQPAEHTDFE